VFDDLLSSIFISHASHITHHLLFAEAPLLLGDPHVVDRRFDQAGGAGVGCRDMGVLPRVPVPASGAHESSVMIWCPFRDRGEE
jgi:hypothetical protein